MKMLRRARVPAPPLNVPGGAGAGPRSAAPAWLCHATECKERIPRGEFFCSHHGKRVPWAMLTQVNNLMRQSLDWPPFQTPTPEELELMSRAVEIAEE